MDIHKPKPWHSVREFLKEYAIVVVGVLTALGAEQAVEQLHWAHEVRSARAALGGGGVPRVRYSLRSVPPLSCRPHPPPRASQVSHHPPSLTHAHLPSPALARRRPLDQSTPRATL